MAKKLPKTMYIVSLYTLDYVCKVNRDFADKDHFRPAGTYANGKYTKRIPKWLWGGIKVTKSNVQWFRTQKQAEAFLEGAYAYKCYLANTLIEKSDMSTLIV